MTSPNSPPPSDAPVDWDKLGRYVADELSASEAEEVRIWLARHPAEAALVEAAKRPDVPASVDVESALRRVKTRLHSRTPLSRREFSSISSWRRYAMLAAAAVVLIAVGVTLRGNSARTAAPVTTVAAAVHATGVGERKTVRLDDGTEVIIGPASRLDVRGREVSLTGEAFFTVVHDPAHPFTVRAGDAIIRDVGTAFAVHDDEGDRVRVVVSEGAVQVNNARDTVQLAQGDVGVLQNGTLAAARGVATPEDLAWTTGKLVFRDAPFTEVAADLKRWYGVEVRVIAGDTALFRRHFTGSFTNESSNRVLEIVALALGAHVERRGDTAYIRAGSSTK